MTGCTATKAPDEEWTQFRLNFILPEGRLVDRGREGTSHSEGQGVALLLAVHYDDPASFASIWRWTRSHLQTRPDKLLAWSWSPQSGVTDANNATDGDLLVAWALARAGKRWQNPAYLTAGKAIARDIRKSLLRRDTRGIVLLPGIEGFEKPYGLVVNLSYWVFPALRELDVIDPAPEWEAVRNTGIDLLREARFGRWSLPADWIALSETLAPAPDFPPRFSYDAVRIPLYLLWARLDSPQILKPFKSYWTHFSGAGFIPAWTNLNDDSIDSYDADAGIRAIARLTLAAPELNNVSLPEQAPDAGYYASALLLLCRVMLADRQR